MLDPPSRKIALILFSAISCCAFCTRAARSSRVIGLTPAVIGLSVARAGCVPPTAEGACALVEACSADLSDVALAESEAEGEGEHPAMPRPRPAAVPV